MTPKKILVTGGAGYIGSHTILELLNAGYQPVSIDNYINSPRNTFDRIAEISGQRVQNAEIDLAQSHQLTQWFSTHPDIEGIIHFAALKAVGESVNQPLLYYRNNIFSLVNILQAAADHGIDNFIFSSSCSVYGNVAQLPVNEDTPLSTSESPYGYTKVCGERMVADCTKASSIRAVMLRYFNPVGAHRSGLLGEYPITQPNNLIPVITQAASGITEQMRVHGTDYPTRDGSCIRDYVHVSDIALAHVQALKYLEKQALGSVCEIFNLGTGSGVSVLEAINAFEATTGIKVPHTFGPRRPGDVSAIYSDCTKALNLLGWRAECNLTEMMRTAWVWQQQLNYEQH